MARIIGFEVIPKNSTSQERSLLGKHNHISEWIDVEASLSKTHRTLRNQSEDRCTSGDHSAIQILQQTTWITKNVFRNPLNTNSNFCWNIEKGNLLKCLKYTRYINKRIYYHTILYIIKWTGDWILFFKSIQHCLARAVIKKGASTCIRIHFIWHHLLGKVEVRQLFKYWKHHLTSVVQI